MIYRRVECVYVCVCMCAGVNLVIGQTWNFSDDARPHGTRRDRLGEWGERPHRAAVSGFLTCSAGRVIVTSHAGAKHAGGGFSRKRARSDVANVLLLRSPPPTSPPPPLLSAVKHIFHYIPTPAEIESLSTGTYNDISCLHVPTTRENEIKTTITI